MRLLFSSLRILALGTTVSIALGDAPAYGQDPTCEGWEYMVRWDGDLSGDHRDLTIDASGNTWIASGAAVIAYAGNGTQVRRWTTLQYDPPQSPYPPDAMGLAVSPGGDVYIVMDGNEVQQFRNDGTFVRRWGVIGSGQGQFWSPRGVAIGPDGNVYVADTYNHRVQVFTADGRFLRTWGSEGGGPGQFDEPTTVVIGADGSVFVSEHAGGRIQKFTPDGAYLGGWPLAAHNRFAMDAEGRFHVPHLVEGRGYVQIRIYSPEGMPRCVWGKVDETDTQFHYIAGLDIDLNGEIVVNDKGRRLLARFHQGTVGAHAATWGELKSRYR